MANISLNPLADRVLIEPEEAETKTASGIIIPETVQEKPSRGTVVAVGSDGDKVKEGEVVMYVKHGGIEIQHEGTDYLIMRESNIYAVIS